MSNMVDRLAVSIPLTLLLTSCAPVVVVVESVTDAPPPSTDIHLFPLTYEGDRVVLGSATNITDRYGYDNQPWFSADSRFIYFSGMGRDTLPDVNRYDIAEGVIDKVYRTSTAEYSPQVRPASDQITVVRVEDDGTQRFTSIGEDGVRLISDISTVGYYVWMGTDGVLMFLVGEPHTLNYYDFSTNTNHHIADDPGRSFKPIPGSPDVSFVHKVSDDTWWIKRFDRATMEIAPVAKTLPGREDFEWLPDGRLLMSDSFAIYINTGAGEWLALAMFTDPALQEITRLAVSPDGKWLALVSVEAVAKL